VDALSTSGRLGLPVGVFELSLLRLSYDCCVIVEPLPLDLSDAPVRLDNTESKEGLIWRWLSLRLRTPLARCLTGRLYIELRSSL